MDPFAELEDLGSSAARRLIAEERRRLQRLLGDAPDRLLGLLRRIHEKRLVAGLAAGRGGVYLLARSLGGEHVEYVSVPGAARRLVASSRPGAHVADIEAVAGSGLVAVHYSPAGRDEGYVELLGPEGVAHARVHGSVAGFAEARGRLLYVRFYRSGRSPDGEEAPVERVVAASGDGEELVWGAGVVRRGEMISLGLVEGCGCLVYTVWRGWSRTEVYVAPVEAPWEAVRLQTGPGVSTPIGWSRVGLLVLERTASGARVTAHSRLGGEPVVVAEVDRPVENAVVVDEETIAIVEIRDYAHSVAFYAFSGRRLWDYVPSEPVSMEAPAVLDGRLVLLESGFTLPYRVSLVDPRGGTVEVLEEAMWRPRGRVSEFWVRSLDGTMVHSWLVSPGDGGGGKGGCRAVLYGYGGFGVSLLPMYRAAVEALLELGYVYVQANLRGGGELGEWWHEAGKRRNKHRVFEDYAAVAEHLRVLGCRVAGWGASNGGLLVAAVETRWPRLLDAALVGYPVLDMLRFHKLYVGALWVDEYGDPEDPSMASYLASYSPYHNIPVGERLPPTLVYTGLGDDRVHPAHALKFVARARSLGHPVYLHVDEESGHRGASVEKRLRQLAVLLAFLEKILAGGAGEGAAAAPP